MICLENLKGRNRQRKAEQTIENSKDQTDHRKYQGNVH